MLDFTKLKLEDVPGVGTIQLELAPGKRAYVFIGENGIGKTQLLKSIYPKLLGDDSTTKQRVVFVSAQDRGHFKEDTPYRVTANIIHQWIIEMTEGANKYRINGKQNEVRITAFLHCLHQVDPKYAPDFLEIDEQSNIFLKIDGNRKRLETLSTGFTSIIKIIQSIIAGYDGDELLKTEGIVLIDEIESHLHLEWQVKIIPKLKELFPNTVFLIATHSPLIISQLEDGEAYELRRNEDSVVTTYKVDHPNKHVMIDLLQKAFHIDLNRLTIDRPISEEQQKARLALMDRLNNRLAAQ